MNRAPDVVDPPAAKPEAKTQGALRIFVLGGTGFIGRHVVAALNILPVQVIIGSREPARYQSSYPDAEFRSVRFERLLTTDAWASLVSDVDVVVNCVGILRQRSHESYDDVHHRAPAALAHACADAKRRLIHTSALGLHHGAKSRFLSSKLLGERAVTASGCDYSIVRPALQMVMGVLGRRGYEACLVRPCTSFRVRHVAKSPR